MRSAFIFCGGGPARLPVEVPDGALVIAADVGLAEANRLGVAVDLLVGDLDSVDPVDLEAFEDAGGEVRRHPEDKDATDLELAITDAIVAGAGRLLVVGGDRGRLDHLLANAVLLASPRHAAVEVDAIFGATRLHVVRGRRELVGVPGELISLFALGGPAHGVRAFGVRWPLDGAVLEPGSSLGVSNRFVTERAVIEVRDGVVLAIRPGVEDDA
ncbi:MAG TPA: thiamine diphosphokinase [Actinomycetota bacterium]|nr:thiamine diphosphokinase [Actinomycetota bacterium]